MKFLLVAKQKKNVDTFQATIARLLRDGHDVRLAIQDRDEERDRRLAGELAAAGPGTLTLVTAPSMRGDAWRLHAPLLRRFRDAAHYLGAPYRDAVTLRQRAMDRLGEELGTKLTDAEGWAGLAAPATARVNDLLAALEAAVPSDRLHEEFIARDRPDAVLVTPGIHFGSAQFDFIKSARAVGVPVWMLVFSWDNLSTKGALHVPPDALFVWNDRQRREAVELHGFAADRVIVAGAPRFDEFFALRPALTRQQFFEPLRLDPGRPTLLYVCSSPFVASRELEFIHTWLAAVRSSADPMLRQCNVLVRPHPDVGIVDESAAAVIQWPGLPRAQGWVSRPFADGSALVLRTTYGTPQAFYECLYHSAAVIGLNTSAELEAGIVGRPVFTVVAQHGAVTGQSNTLHFHYLLSDAGGFVVSARDLETHLAQVAGAVAGTGDEARIRRFVGEFLRPHGDRPVADVLAEAIVSAASRADAGVNTGAASATSPVVDDLARSAAEAAVEYESAQPAKLLRVGYPGSSLRVPATPETRNRRRAGYLVLEPELVAWLDGHVHPGDVVYDIGSGIGECALVAAVHRGALVVALEPGFASFRRLCENIVRNQCGRSVIPLPVALGDRTGLLELEYAADATGEDRHRLKERQWRARPDAPEAHYVQPVVAETLDAVIARYRLPSPHHLRIRVRGGVEGVLAGAKATLRQSVRSLLVPDEASGTLVVTTPQVGSRFWSWS